MNHILLKTKLFCLIGSILICLSAAAQFDLELESTLTKREKDWIAVKPVLKIAHDPDFPPIEFRDDDGEYKGIAVEFIDLIEERLGITFQIVPFDNWDDVLIAARNREVDILAAASPSPQRLEYMNSTAPHLIFPGVIITRNTIKEKLTIADLLYQNVAIVSGYVWQDFLENDYPEISIYPVPDVKTGLQEVSSGTVYAMISYLPVAIYYIEKEGISNLKIAGESGLVSKLSILSRNDWPILNSILDKAIKSLPEDEKDKITRKWIHIGQLSLFNSRELWIFFSAIISLSALIIIFIVAWNRSLQKKVNQKTAELKEDNTKRKQVEKFLRESEEKYKLVAENSLVGIYITQNHIIKYCNKKFADIFGHDQEELLDKNIKTLITPEDWEYVEEMNRPKSIDRDEVTHYEFKGKKKDGSVIDIQTLGSKIIFRETSSIQGNILDITQRKQYKLLNDIQYNISSAVNTTNNLDELYESIKDNLSRILNTSNFYIALYDGKNEIFDLHQYKNEVLIKQEITARKTLPKYVIDSGMPLFADREMQKNLKDQGEIELPELTPKLWLGSPLRFKDEIIGVVALQDFMEDNSFDKRDLRLLSFVSDEIAKAIIHKRHMEMQKISLKEKIVLLQEVHHRVKNNLQIVSSLLNMQANTISDENIAAYFIDSKNRINSMALIHESLYRSEDLTNIDFSHYAKLLTSKLIKSFQINSLEIKLNLDIENIFLDINLAIPCGLLISEIVSNSIKHAFPNLKEGKIMISFRKKNEYHLSIEDNGIGLPENIDPKKSDTMGMQLIDTIIKQLNSDIEIERKHGTKYIIDFRYKEIKTFQNINKNIENA